MVWFVLMHLVGLSVDLLSRARGTDDEKDLQIALLRYQVRLLQRRSPRPPRLAPWENLTLAVLATKLSRLATSPQALLARALLVVQPETVLKWHRELVRRKWTYRRVLCGIAVEPCCTFASRSLSSSQRCVAREEGRCSGQPSGKWWPYSLT